MIDRDNLNNFFNEVEKTYNEKYAEFLKENYPEAYYNNQNSSDTYRKIIKNLSDEELHLIIRYSKHRLIKILKDTKTTNNTYGYYTYMLKAIFARKRLDMLTSGNLQNYSINYKNRVKRLHEDIKNFIEDEEHTIILPENKSGIHKAIKLSLANYLTLKKIKSFIASLERLYSKTSTS